MKRNKLFLAVSVCLLSFSLLLGGCASKQPQAAKPEAIHITYVKAPLNVPSIVEKKLGLFEKEFGKDSIKVDFPEITVGPKQIEALAAGSVDFAHCLGGTTALMAAANGVDLKIIGIYSRAPKAFVILVKDPSIQTITDLKGKKVAGPKGTVLHQLLLTALAKENLTAQDVSFVPLDIPGSVAALLSGNVDVALAAGPDVLKAQQAGARILTNGDGLVEATIVTAVRGEFLRQHPDLVKRFMQVHKESLAYLKSSEDKALQLTAEETGLSLTAVQQMYPWYDFDPSVKASDITELEKTQDFLMKNGMMTKKVNLADLIVSVE
ncbi:MAG: NrtA/SsuA/CpmA family ABC transporter substrate-binding protein [Sporomusaceae bacterium]|nr:NrtA/SsuA/CpmA family ABC transporter substrate-binding protein [Sporomusaceae bacterium]